MVRWLREQGLEAGAFATQYGDDTVEADALGSVETVTQDAVTHAPGDEARAPAFDANDTASRS
jgi:putative mRNA 3-end processing factor